jgi:hypothetical protein
MSEAYFHRVLSGSDTFTEMFSRRTSRVLAGAITMANSGEPFLQILDANGVARNVNLPLETANDGKLMLIINVAAGAFALTLQSNAGAALSPAVAVAQGKAVLVFCDGTAWRALAGA